MRKLYNFLCKMEIALCGAGFIVLVSMVFLSAILRFFRFSMAWNIDMALVLLMLGFLFITGMFLDSNVNFLLLTPIFLPIVTTAGIDPVHFGVLMATMVTLGVMTPPIGSALYTVCGIIDCKVEEYTVASIPFFVAICLLLAILVFIPNLVLFIPNMIFG